MIFQSSRTIFAASNNNHMPSLFGLVTLKYHTPMMAVIISGLLGLTYLLIKDIYTLLNMSMVVFFVNHIATIVALLLMRRTQPDEPRPIKVNLFFPVSFLLICFYITFMIFLQNTTDFMFTMVQYVVGIVGYYVFVKCAKPQKIQDQISKYQPFLVVISQVI